MYKNLIEKIAREALKGFDAILATYNFENGTEFEVALCKILRQILPKKYSICRGFIVTQGDEIAGDDIIIYDATAFPKIRIIEDELCVKQYIPIEAVYAYIEAKHTLNLKGSEENVSKAFDQVYKVKSLERPRRAFQQILDNKITLGNGLSVTRQENWPGYLNPLFTCIISRCVTPNSKDDFVEAIGNVVHNKSDAVDLIIGGENYIGIPSIGDNISSPFFIPNKSKRQLFDSENSFGVGIANLIWALEYIKLGTINYPNLIGEALNLKIDGAVPDN